MLKEDRLLISLNEPQPYSTPYLELVFMLTVLRVCINKGFIDETNKNLRNTFLNVVFLVNLSGNLQIEAYTWEEGG